MELTLLGFMVPGRDKALAEVLGHAGNIKPGPAGERCFWVLGRAEMPELVRICL